MSDSGGGTGGVEAELDRDIGIVGAVALGVGTMIAAGIFVLSGLAVSNVGTMAIGSFLIAAVVASFTALAYAEFSAIYPESGGGYAYVSNVFDTDLTYLVGWSMILGYPASAAFYLASFSDWFYRFLYPALNIPKAIPFWVSGLLILGLLVGINLKGTEETGAFQIVVTTLKVLLIIFFLYGGLQAFDATTIQQSFYDNVGQFRQIGLTSALVFITFFGFEAIATNAEEIENPGTNVPRAIFISMGFVTVVYTLVVLVIVIAVNNPDFLDFLTRNAELGGLSPSEFIANSGEVSMAFAAEYYLGNVGFYVIIVGALFSMLSAANATILAGSRVKLAMSRRGHLPDRFEQLHPELNTPYYSVLLTGVLITLFILLFTVVFGGGPESEAALVLPGVGYELHLGIDAIAHFADFMLLFGLIVVNFAIVQSRRQSPDIDRPFRMPGVPYLPAFAVVANLVLLGNVSPSSLLLGVVAEILGVGFWFAWKGRTPSTESLERETPTVVAEHDPTERDYQVVVPIANPAHIEQLMRTAVDLARDNDGEILVLAVVNLPDQTPLSEGRKYTDDRREVVEEAMAFAEDTGVPISGTVRIGHHPGHAILNTLQQYDSDAALLGWGGRYSPRRDIVLGSVVDEVVTEAPCDVYVERIGQTESRPQSILFPTAGGPHSEVAAKVVRAVARANDATVEVMHVVPSDADQNRRTTAENAVADAIERLEDVRTERSVVESDDVVDAIVERSAAHNLTVIGATKEGLLEQLVFGGVPEQVAQRAESTIIMAKKRIGVANKIKYAFLPR